MALKQKRWMKSVIETSKSDMPALPWSRTTRQAKASRAPSGATTKPTRRAS